jgi:hypothetical protein
MTIRKGEQWGSRISTPSRIRHVSSDAEIAQCSPEDFIAVGGGDIYTTLGSPAFVSDSDECTLLPMDALQVEILLSDASEKSCTAASCIEVGSLVSPLKSGRYICVTNGGIVSGRNLAPRAHPNDGRLDIMQIAETMSFRDRLTARKKALTGTHVPHPSISHRQDETFSAKRSGEREKLRVDGVSVANWIEVSVSIVPDYWQIVV